MRFLHFFLLCFLLFLNGITANVVDSSSDALNSVVKTSKEEEEVKEKTTQEYCSISSSNAECNAEYNNNNNNKEDNVVTVVGVDSTNTVNADNTVSNDSADDNDSEDEDEYDNDNDNDSDDDVEGEDTDSDVDDNEADEADAENDDDHDDNNNNEPQQPKEQKIQSISNTLFENANIGLPMSFTPTIEEIDTKEKLFELIPQQSQQQKQQPQQQSNIKNHTEGGGIGGTFNNVLLAIYDEECASELMSNPFFLAGYYNMGPGVLHTVRMKKNVYPKIVAEWNLPETSCMHVLFIKKGSYYHDSHRFRRLSVNDPQGMAVFLEDHLGLEINVTNTLPYDVFLNWWGDEAEPMEVGYIIAKQTSKQSSFLGHIFYAEDAVSRRLVNWFIVVGEGAVSVKASNYCEEEKIVDADACDKKFRDSFKSFVYNYWARKREALNYVQRTVVKPVTEKGFLLMDLPDSLHDSLLNFVQWSDEENWWLKENQTAPIVNYEQSSSYLSHLGEEQRDELDTWLTPQIQQWSDIEHIELQSIFGLRKYTKHAQIQMHVDPITSHLLSAIIFVKSSSPSEEWPIQILDNHDTLHEIIMQPGQVLLYESARDPCARIKPFSGESYITLYAHFKSQDEDDIHNYDWMFQEEILCSASPATNEITTETIGMATVK